jgi:hypothetical protein
MILGVNDQGEVDAVHDGVPDAVDRHPDNPHRN